MPRSAPPPTDDDGTPNYVPLVGFDENDEPFIVRTQVVRPSPVPFWMTLVIIFMCALSVAQIFYFGAKRTSDQRCELNRDQALALALQQRLDTAEQDRQTISNLVTSVTNARSQKDVSRALHTFIIKSRDIDEEQAKQRALVNTLLEASCAKPNA